jgi:hypothetical protein
MSADTIGIRPQVSILSVLKHLNYKPWYALAEFVDNSIDSYQKHKVELKTLHGDSYHLRVAIDFDSGQNQIQITDNAAGIAEQNFQRAFRIADAPSNKAGLSEFGMGMKAAACWFSPLWVVTSTALGETERRRVSFDIPKIVAGKIEELEVRKVEAKAEQHFTNVLLTQVESLPRRGTITKIKEYLGSIYRQFIISGELELLVNNEPVSYTRPAVLEAPYFAAEDGSPSIKWVKEIAFECWGKSITGFAGIRDKGSTAEAGFALFRRGRVIEGNGEEGFRPSHIFGQSNSYSYQRVFGELHLDDFGVSHTKDGFQWEGIQEDFIEALRKHLDADAFPLLRQAEGYRKNPKPDAATKKKVEAAVTSTAKAIESALENDIQTIIAQKPPVKYSEVLSPASVEPEALENQAISREIKVDFNGGTWLIHIELSYDPAHMDWIEVGDHLLPSGKSKDVHQVGIRMSLSCPFSKQFIGSGSEQLEVMLRIAAAFGLAEVSARAAGVQLVSTVRHSLNSLLAGSLSQAAV